MRHIRLIFKRPTSGDIVFQAAFTRADGTTTYTEESPYALTGTFAGPAAINLNSLDLTGGTGYVTFPGVQNVITATDGAYSTARSMWGVQQYFESSADAKLDYVEFTVL